MAMMRWLMLAIAILGFAMVFVTRSPVVLGVGLVLGFVGVFGLVFSLAADRVSATARPDSAMLDSEDLAALRARRAVNPTPASPAAKNTAVPDRTAPPR